MTALKEQWQEQKQQRQAELARRRQQVRETLDSYTQKRQAIASQMRDDLSLYQLQLQQEIQSFLTDTNQQRQQKAQEVAQMLRSFMQELQNDTTQLLQLLATDRASMAQALTQDLTSFHKNLSASVATLRQGLQARMSALQAEVQALQADTQILLQMNHEQRLQQKLQLARELTLFMEGLQSTVQTYLTELNLLRQQRAQQVRHMLQADQEQRAAKMEAIFRELSEFRLELRQFCSELQWSVWGSNTYTPVPTQHPQPMPKATTPMVKKPLAQEAPAPLVVPKLADLPASPIEQPAPVLQSVAVAVAAPAPVIELPPASSEPASEPIQENPEPVVAAIPALVPATIQQDAAQLENAIYSYVHGVKGARLTEIESALGINRFQAVDALRSLIKKGWITQRDRIYLIQEEVSL